MDASELLKTYNPVLVILPRDVMRHRPWNRVYQVVRRQRGDYQPCTAEFFLSFVSQSSGKKAWSPFSATEQSLPDSTGLAALRAMVEAARRTDIADWEIDISTIKSREPDQAWAAYGVMLEREAALSERVVYARYIAGPPAVLQYWYLYVYNDAPNKHEGDWEMVQIEMDAAGETPVRAGYAGHASGFVRDWAGVEKHNGRPVVYVARGSHAAYFDHDPKGHRTNSLRANKGFPEPINSGWEWVVRSFQNTAAFLRLQDWTCANPTQEPGSEPGDLLDDLRLIELPERAEPDAEHPELWWLRLDCPWGSSHARFFGSAAPPPPWRQLRKWEHPSLWMDDLTASPPP